MPTFLSQKRLNGLLQLALSLTLMKIVLFSALGVRLSIHDWIKWNVEPSVL
ncbi:hypothetical protein XBKQ1_2630068 [Xenorhabdus bovienii str. kraussei Quebec]|uniref:Uncharacterized protein n=1 Tax=Xenorhabdus bovienii str. kraussei Quebec TaxID=1398203 RepID=A0A077P7M2_XENBV|nr:hypothetical protein XBKQ1_2630068 [Xenorhabdus bovienii str. kraussei Quebec]